MYSPGKTEFDPDGRRDGGGSGRDFRREGGDDGASPSGMRGANDGAASAKARAGRAWLGWVAMVAVGLLMAGCGSGKPAVTLLVMDPLAKELACPCVGGYAQRNYRALAEFLTRESGVRLAVVFSDDLGKGYRMSGTRPVGLIVGKDSVVRHDAAARDVALTPWFRLSDREGKTTQTGLFVVRKNDPARNLAEVKGRKIFFGPADSAEKNQAALAALKAAGVPVPEVPETCPGCSEAAARVVESERVPPPVGVISSYAFPLLEGCGTVPAGALRVLAETEPVPFVTCFATAALPAEAAAPLQAALRRMREQPELLKKLESRDGWVSADLPPPPAPSGPAHGESAAGQPSAFVPGWPDWRGPARDGRVAWLPDRLPARTNWVWRQPLSGAGLAGLSVAEGLVFVADRDPFDERDVFLAFRAADGELVWQFEYRAVGELDYGQAPRATPVVRDGRAYLLGAFGHLHCVSARDGKAIWKRELAREFGAVQPKWGYASTPLLVGRRLIVNPGGAAAALVALDPQDGRVLWKSPGNPPGHASFVLAEFGGRRQVVGYDQASLGGWDPETGRRLWALVPSRSGDFNVPTPLLAGGRLVVVTENNGTRLHAFGADGAIVPEPLAVADELRSETASPVLAGGLVVGWDHGIHCLDPEAGLKEVWKTEEPAAGDHASLLATDARVLAASQGGELLLVDVTARPPAMVSRLRVAEDGSGGYAHPAMDGHRLYLRDERSVRCLSLE